MTQCVGLRRTPRRPSRLPAPVKCYYFLPPSSEYLRNDVAPEKATHHPSLPSRSSGILRNMNHFYGSACFVLESEKKKGTEKKSTASLLFKSQSIPEYCGNLLLHRRRLLFFFLCEQTGV